MKYVVDASVALKWVLPEIDSRKALGLRDDFRAGVHALVAPEIFPVEIGHALTRAERRGRLVAPAAELNWRFIIGDCPILHACLPLMPRALSISSSQRHGLHDCLYIALAEQEGCELVTADTRILTKLGTQFPFIKPLAGFP